MDDYPVLKNWKVSPLFSVLGAFAGLLLGDLIGALVYVSNVLWFVVGLAYLALMIVYALVVYPSYFKERPLVKSNRAISFLNLFAGFVIFGCIWNHNLTLSQSKETPHKGVSNVVYTVLEIIGILLMIAALYLSSIPQGFWGHCEGLPDVPSLSISVKNGRVIDSTAKISFAVPKGWSAEPRNSSDGARCYLTPENSKKGGVSYVISYSAYEMDAKYWRELTKKDLAKAATGDLDNCTVKEIDHGTSMFSKLVCWRAKVMGTLQDSGQTIPVNETFLAFYNNGFVYIYQLLLIDSAEVSAEFVVGQDALYKITQSVTFQ